jgi:hypothetical protein
MFRSHIGLKLALVTLLIILSACNLPFFAVTSTPIIPEEVLDSQVVAMHQLEEEEADIDTIEQWVRDAYLVTTTGAQVQGFCESP